MSVAGKRVLIFSESFGLGHERAASALIKGLKKIDDSLEVLHTNSIRNSFPLLTGVFLNLYLQVINTVPRYWHRIYEKGRIEMKNESSKRLIYRLLSQNIKKVINDFKPDVVVCTHPFPAAVISLLKRQGLDVPLVGIITDYDVHAYWLDENVDMYIIGDRTLEADFDTLKFKPRGVSSTGIPIDPVFRNRIEKEHARELAGLEKDHPAVIVAGGGWGLGDLGRIGKKIADIPEKPQVVIVTGVNSKLERSLRKSFSGYSNVKIEGFVDNMHEYLQASDVLVTKPGGLTTSEGLATGLPMVLFDVIYGQESWNARFLTKNEAAIKTDSVEGIPGIVKTVIENSDSGEKMSQKALEIGKPESGIVAAAKILGLAC